MGDGQVESWLEPSGKQGCEGGAPLAERPTAGGAGFCGGAHLPVPSLGARGPWPSPCGSGRGVAGSKQGVSTDQEQVGGQLDRQLTPGATGKCLSQTVGAQLPDQVPGCTSCGGGSRAHQTVATKAGLAASAVEVGDAVAVAVADAIALPSAAGGVRRSEAASKRSELPRVFWSDSAGGAGNQGQGPVSTSPVSVAMAGPDRQAPGGDSSTQAGAPCRGPLSGTHRQSAGTAVAVRRSRMNTRACLILVRTGDIVVLRSSGGQVVLWQ